MISQDVSPGFCWTLQNEDIQDCVLGDFQPSLAGLVSLGTYTQHSRAGLLSAVPSGFTSGPAVLTQTLKPLRYCSCRV